MPSETGKKSEGVEGQGPLTGEVLPPTWATLWPFGGSLPPRPASRRTLLAGAAILGVFGGAVAAAISGVLTSSRAASGYATALDLRDAPIVAPNAGGAGRWRIIEALISAGAPERLEGPAVGQRQEKPRVVIVFDDLGPDRRALDRLMALPGPLTMSFLPYADGVEKLAAQALSRGNEILLHLPMEPSGNSDPGPGALTSSMDASELFTALGDNLAAFDGYAGVNNHMGSRLTRDEQAMKRILAFLDRRGLFFLDSLTTGDSKAAAAGSAVGAEVLVRDVFLDAEPGQDAVRRQLALAERIAAETGYVIAIAHPREDTLAIVGPWLTSAPARGFRIETITGLRAARSGAYAQNAVDARLR